MRKTLAILTLALVALNVNAETVKIGVILPLSGNNAQLGEWQRDAVRLVQKELKERKTRHAYEFVLEDDQLQSRLTAQALNKLINIDHVAGLMTFFSAAGNVAAPRAEQAKIPHFCIGSDAKIAKGDYNFLHWTPPATEAALFTKYIKARGYKRVAFLAVRQQGIIAIMTDIKKLFAQEGISVVDETYFNPGERDFRIILARIKEKQPDIFVPIAFSPEAEIILRQRKEVGFEAPLTTIEAFDFLSAEDRKSIEGYYYATCGQPTEAFKAGMKSIGVDAWAYTPFTYDTLYLLVDALEQCAEPNKDRTAAIKYLNAVKDRPSAVGTISMGPEGIVQSPAGLYQIRGGKSVPVRIEDVK